MIPRILHPDLYQVTLIHSIRLEPPTS
jgi:hypothetical protein